MTAHLLEVCVTAVWSMGSDEGRLSGKSGLARTGRHRRPRHDHHPDALLAVDPPSTEGLRRHHVAAFHALSLRLREIIEFLDRRDVDDAALRINELLVEYPARPHLAKEDGQWRLHHHPIEAELVAMWSAITADALARLIGAGRAERAGICEAEGCSNAFIDGSKNGTRRFCSTTCQNRVKAASFRRRSR